MTTLELGISLVVFLFSMTGAIIICVEARKMQAFFKEDLRRERDELIAEIHKAADEARNVVGDNHPILDDCQKLLDRVRE